MNKKQYQETYPWSKYANGHQYEIEAEGLAGNGDEISSNRYGSTRSYLRSIGGIFVAGLLLCTTGYTLGHFMYSHNPELFSWITDGLESSCDHGTPVVNEVEQPRAQIIWTLYAAGDGWKRKLIVDHQQRTTARISMYLTRNCSGFRRLSQGYRESACTEPQGRSIAAGNKPGQQMQCRWSP
ncbi:hypothetical protein N431DRAFT_465841 [Stipitochalara longipes BDJ]|nr:hypothetical protein N431DRAFT_465841 [Stipitochalara longipes BDJ]